MAFAVVAGTALAVGLGALLWAACTLSDSFDMAGTMHDFSYLGGFLGILTASGYLIWVRVKSRS